MFLAPEELRVCEQAELLFKAFAELEQMRGSDLTDVAFHIHAIQNIIMARSAQRAFPDVGFVLNT
jgi:hypothetical protein